MTATSSDKKSIIDMQIDSIVRQTMQICQNFLSNLPDIQLGTPESRNKLMEYYENFFKNDHSIVLALTPLTLTVSKVIDQIFTIIENAFPTFDLYSTANPKEQGSKSLVATFLNHAKWDNHVVRLSILIFLDFLRASFVHHTILLSRDLSDDQALTFTNRIVLNVVDNKINEEDLQYFYVSARKWGKCLHELSIIYSYPAETAAYQFIEELYNSTMSDSKRLIKQSLLSSVMFGIATDLAKLDTQLTQKSTFFNKKKEFWSLAKPTSQGTDPLHNTAIEFLSNLYSSIFISTPKTRTDSFLLNAYNRADEIASKHGYCGPACGCRARILSFNRNPNLKISADDYYFKKIQKNLSSELHVGHAIEEMSYLLAGENQISKNSIDDFCQNLAKNSSILKNYQEQLIECFLSMFNHHSNLFASHLRETFTNPFAEHNYAALFESGFKILFPDELEDNDSDSKIECRFIYKELITSRLFAASNDLGTKLTYNVMSFVDSLLYHANLVTALEFTAQESLPQPMKQASSPATTQIRKLLKLLPKDYDDSYFATASSVLSVLGTPQTQLPSLAYALHTLALTDLDETIAPDVVPHIFNSAPAVSAAAVRSLQTMIAREPKMFTNIFESIVNVYKDRLLKSYESLVIGINCLSHIISSTCSSQEFHQNLPQKVIVYVNAIYLIGLCVPQPTVRQQALNAIDSFASLYQNIETAGSFLRLNETQIVSTALQNLLRAGRFGSYIIETMSIIKFNEISNSSYEKAFLFFLSSYMKLISKTDIISIDSIDTANSLIENSKIPDIGQHFCMVNAAFVDNIESKKFIKLIEQTNEICHSNEALGLGIFCALKDDIFIQYIATLKYSSYLYKPILFGLRTYVTNSPPEAVQENIGLIFDVLAVFFDYFTSKNIKSDHIKPLYELPDGDPNISMAITSFLEFGAYCFESIYNRLAMTPAGLYARVPALVSKFPFSTDYKSWFALTLNLVRVEKVTEAAQTCLSALLAVFSIPEFCFLEFVNSIDYFTDGNPLLLSRFLLRCIETQLAVFTEKAETDVRYFHAIANMFPAPDAPLMELQTSAIENYENKNENEGIFSEKILYSSGTLLGLAFYYVMGDSIPAKKSAIRILRAVGLGTATAFCSPVDVAIVYKNINDLTSNILNHIHGSALNPAITLSAVFHKKIPQIGEQIVLKMMQLASAYPTLASAIEPWLSNVCFSDYNDKRVIVGTIDKFAYSTAFSFTEDLLSLPKNINTLKLVRRAIEGQSKESDNIAHFIIVTIMLNHVLRGENSQFETIIAYIFMVSPDIVIRDILQFLRFAFWHYHETTNGKYDALFDIDKFIGQALNKNEDEGDSDLISYEEAISFVIRTIKTLFEQSTTDFDKYKPWLVIFTIITMSQFQEDLIEFRSIIPICFSGQEDQIAKMIRDLDDETKNLILNELLTWGLCCGDLQFATRALKLYIQTADKLDAKEIIQKATRNLYVCALCLYEKSNGLAKPRHSQWFYVIVDDQQNVDWKMVTLYITNLLELIKKCVELSDEVFVDAFWTAAAFTICGTVEYVSILNAAIDIMIEILKKQNASDKIRSHGRPNNFDGVLSLISESKFNKETVPRLLLLSTLLEQNNLVNVALDDTNAAQFVFVALHALADITGNESETRNQLMTSSSPHKIGEGDANIAFRLLGQIAATTTGLTQQMIFDFCAALMTMVNCKIDETTVSIIASTCANNNQSYAADSLLSIIQSRGGTIKRVINTIASTIAPKFPKIHFLQKYEFNDAFDDNEDCFASPTTFPPLFINDTGFFPCSLQSVIHDTVQCAPAQPFTKWSKQMFKAQMKPMEEENETVTIKIEDGLFAKVKNIVLKEELEGSDNDDLENDQNISTSNKDDEQKSPQEEVVNYRTRREENEIDWSLFIPSTKVVCDLSSGLFDGLDVPSVFD
ncbi:hypothetical protein TVAG_204460 [Trichomonas vaginalis G3]|uniref:Uncharacterized protein n=1 Tax=Trichomonas vaginalis (strain ATCC PRA-98 / G3) TaxID=412133 RepID=A2FJ40_TRIV3|nr:hypothetical protein TVAGG3_0879390 [Trichomonas vaginalis G3]EAX95104.1 hypothetical protein TVAG_204460 [Trichomonas vaginalis G3]KAI5501939.1 hypothetical protein TVAGG3_0879390 [Trichomonas vaginalis G3]|eukprot:XP_001308034.1 hypothetical protein [Trichomonas vaginalis G3]